MVPIGTVADVKNMTSPYRVPRYNLNPAAEVQGVAAPGVATGTALHRMEELAAQVLPPGIGFEWTETAFLQQQKGTPTALVFGAAALFVFLVLAAKYESWKVPLAVVLIVPMCLLASVSGLMFHGMPIDILAQIGFVVLVGLAAKNAILIVEFARQHQEKGGTPVGGNCLCSTDTPTAHSDDVPCLYPGFAPLVVATGAGAEMRQSLGTAVFGGMLGVTAFGLIFTPAFYTLVRRIRSGGRWAYDAACEVLRRAPGDQRCPPLVGGHRWCCIQPSKKSGTFSRRCRDIGATCLQRAPGQADGSPHAGGRSPSRSSAQSMR